MGNAFGQFFGIDFGTENTYISKWGRGVVLIEPTIALMDAYSQEPVAVGADAALLMRQAPGRFSVELPIRSGVVQNFELARQVLRHYVKKVLTPRIPFFDPVKAVMCIPCGLPATEMIALEYVAEYAGLRDILLLEEPVAAALGEGLDVVRPVGKMVVKIGAGEGCAAVVTMAGIAEYEKIDMGGAGVDQLIAGYVFDRYGIHIGDTVAKYIKAQLGSEAAKEGFGVTGRSALTGFPEEVFVYAEEFQNVLGMAYAAVTEAIFRLFKKTSPELVSDISEEGLLFCGGGALLHGLLDYVKKEVDLPVRLAENPQAVLAEGGARAAGLYLSRRNSAVV